MASLALGVKFNAASNGTGDFVYSSVVTGYAGPGASSPAMVDGKTYRYRAESGDLSQWEWGFGAYTASTQTIARSTVTLSSTGAKVSFTLPPVVGIVPFPADILQFDDAMSLTAAQQGMGRSNIGAAPGGFVNRLRNSSLTSWFHGSASRTIAISGGWGAEGIYIVPAGAGVTAAQSGNGLSAALSYFSQLITGAASVTGVVVRFVVESHDAQPLVGQQVTFQVPVLNNTGGTITPAITVKHAAAQDATYSNVDVGAVSLQPIANGATGVLAYSWTVAAGSGNGLSINIDFGNNFSSSGKSIQIGGGFDLRATPGLSTGLVSAPQVPEIRTAAEDMLWNMRFFETSYNNGVLPGTVTTAGMSEFRLAGIGAGGSGTTNIVLGVQFAARKRAAPAVTTYSPNTGASGKARDAFFVDVATTISPVGEASFVWAAAQSGNTTSTDIAINWTADATLAGG